MNCYQIALVLISAAFVILSLIGEGWGYLAIVLFYFPVHWLIYKVING